MYLSRLILNPRSRRVQREIAQPYQMHRSLMRSFPDGLDRERDRVLFRIETGRRNGPLTILLQSTLEPCWDWLDESGAKDYLLRPPECKPFDLNLVPGQVLAFRLRANPTVKREGKRHGLFREKDQIAWLKRKGESGGFRLLSARTGGQDSIGGTIRRDNEKHKLKLLSVQFDGRLQVTDPAQLQETIRRGIGSGKGFGFGLLSLAPPMTS